MLRTTSRILRGLQVDRERMLENLNSGGGIVFSGRVLLALVESGMCRDDAYTIVQGAAMRAWEGEEASGSCWRGTKPFANVLEMSWTDSSILLTPCGT